MKYVIIGGGPSGLCLLWVFAKHNKNVSKYFMISNFHHLHSPFSVLSIFIFHGPMFNLKS